MTKPQHSVRVATPVFVGLLLLASGCAHPPAAKVTARDYVTRNGIPPMSTAQAVEVWQQALTHALVNVNGHYLQGTARVQSIDAEHYTLEYAVPMGAAVSPGGSVAGLPGPRFTYIGQNVQFSDVVDLDLKISKDDASVAELGMFYRHAQSPAAHGRIVRDDVKFPVAAVNLPQTMAALLTLCPNVP